MSFFLLGLSLGLSAGLAPGPLLALVIQRTLRYGVGSGLRIALAPLLTDLPIVAVAILIIARLPQIWLRGLMVAGGFFVLWLAWEAWQQTDVPAIDKTTAPSARQDFWRGMMVNFLNPHPYLFWATVGAPLVIQSWRVSPWSTVSFVLSFYLLLVGSKVVLALLLGRVRHLPARPYRLMMQGSALLLLAVGGFMLYSAWKGGLA